MVMNFLFLFLTLSSMSPLEKEPMSKQLLISLEGVRNSNGYILVSLFSQADGFPDNKDKADKIMRVKAKSGTMQLEFTDLDKSTYAFAIIHDENDNKKLDTGLFGIPKEGFCFSKDAMGTFGPPDFAEAAFDLKYAKVSEHVKIKYW